MQANVINDTLLRAALQAAKGARERLPFLLSAKAGLRAKEIAGLKWGSVREDDTILELVTTEGDKPRPVPVDKMLREALQAYRAECADLSGACVPGSHSRPGIAGLDEPDAMQAYYPVG